jgi:hypothetical protein
LAQSFGVFSPWSVCLLAFGPVARLYTMAGAHDGGKASPHGQCWEVNKREDTRRLWLTSVILATWEAEIGRIVVAGQPEQILCETLFPK